MTIRIHSYTVKGILKMVQRNALNSVLTLVKFHKRFLTIRLHRISKIVAWKLVVFVFSRSKVAIANLSVEHKYVKTSKQNHVIFQMDEYVLY